MQRNGTEEHLLLQVLSFLTNRALVYSRLVSRKAVLVYSYDLSTGGPCATRDAPRISLITFDLAFGQLEN
jgi:hypothetical protein